MILLFAGHRGYAQTSIAQADSLQIKEKKGQTEGNANEQNGKGMGNKQQAGRNNGSQAVKHIKGGRPDMTRARGAPPPSVVRPSGSGIPKGVGKPGGIGHKGGR